MKSVFISHSNKEPDGQFTGRLYSYLSENKIDCWCDKSMQAGSWKEQIVRRLQEASVMILVASENSLVSDEVAKEISIMSDARKLIIPIVLDDYYFNPDNRITSAAYDLGGNSKQAVIMKKYADETAAFERLLQLLPTEIYRAVNNPADFVYSDGDKKLDKYNGHDGCVVIPNYVKEIAEGAFLNNSELEKVIIPPSVERIGVRAFFGCKNLFAVDGATGIKSVGVSAFEQSGIFSEKKDVASFLGIVFGGELCGETSAFPANARVIADEAFRYGELNTLILPEGVQYIGKRAFADCVTLKEAVFPKSLVGIDKKAFSGCCSLKRVIFRGSVPIDANEAFDNLQKILVEEGA